MTVKVEQVLDAPIHLVWEAITKPEQMRQWYFADMPDFKPELGFTTSFRMESHDRNIFTAVWQVIEVIPAEKIVCNWSYKEYPGLGIVSFILSPKGEQTLITVLNDGLASFPQDIPEFTEESCLAGGQYFITKHLPKYLENTH